MVKVVYQLTGSQSQALLCSAVSYCFVIENNEQIRKCYLNVAFKRNFIVNTNFMNYEI